MILGKIIHWLVKFIYLPRGRVYVSQCDDVFNFPFIIDFAGKTGWSSATPCIYVDPWRKALDFLPHIFSKQVLLCLVLHPGGKLPSFFNRSVHEPVVRLQICPENSFLFLFFQHVFYLQLNSICSSCYCFIFPAFSSLIYDLANCIIAALSKSWVWEAIAIN